MTPRPRCTVLTVSTPAVADPGENRTGPVAAELLVAMGCQVDQDVVGDDVAAIQQAIRSAVADGAELVLTCGGTGVRPEEVTVEATRPLLEREVPGIGEEVRRLGARSTPLALLSRGLAGVVAHDGRRALVVNAPGSRGGVRDTVQVLQPLLGPLLADLHGAPRT